MGLIIFLLVYLAFYIVVLGLNLSYWVKKFPHISYDYYDQDVSFSYIFALSGPLGLVAILVTGGHNGFLLPGKKAREIAKNLQMDAMRSDYEKIFKGVLENN